MLTACQDELPNPHNNCVREILNALIIQHNDYRRMTSEMRNLQAEFKAEMRALEFPCSELRRLLCCSQFNKGDSDQFLKRVARVNEVHNCFMQRIENLEAKLQITAANARNCLTALQTEKNNLRRFHENTVDHLKRTMIMSDDLKVIANCEKDLCQMHKMFIKEVAKIKKVEFELQPFFEQIKMLDDAAAAGGQQYTTCDCLKQYEWIPADKGLTTVDGIGEQIKMQMGGTLVKAFAQVHLHQPSDVKGFLAAYLLNLERNDRALQEKMKLLGNVETIACEIVL